MEDKISTSISVNGKEYTGALLCKDSDENAIMESARALMEIAARLYCRDKFHNGIYPE
jgi:hypothetical protein